MREIQVTKNTWNLYTFSKIFVKCIEGSPKLLKRHCKSLRNILNRRKANIVLYWDWTRGIWLKWLFYGVVLVRTEYSTGVEYSEGLKKFFVIRDDHILFPSQTVCPYLFNSWSHKISLPPQNTPLLGGVSFLSCS